MNDNAPISRRRMGRRRGRKKLLQLIERYGLHCWLCNRAITRRPTMDHVMPVSRGGSHHIENLRLAHFTCNQARGNGPIPELLLTRDMRLDPSPRSVALSAPESRAIGAAR